MQLENLVFDAVDPVRLGRFWAEALGAEPMLQEDNDFEARLSVPDGPWLDLCFERVPELSSTEPRLHLDLLGGAEQDAVVERLIGLGARHLDIGQHDVPWVVLADPEGNAFCVMEERTAYQGTGPIAAVPMDTADPHRAAEFWAAMTGWVPAPGLAPATLRHPTMGGLLLELCPEPAPKQVKNRMHLDVRCDPGEDLEDQVAWALELGASRVEHDWGDLPWVVLADPSGNEFCILPPSAGAGEATP